MESRRARNFVPHGLAAAALAVGLFAAPVAKADPGAPAFVQQRFNLPCTPQCTLCHSDNNGQYGNIRPATKPGGGLGPGFILTLRDKCGFVPTDKTTWPTAFDQLQKFAFDTDGDGKTDYAELSDGEDPNDGTAGASLCGPTYGCVRVAPGTSVDGFALVASGAVLFFGIALVRRRRSAGR
jgi:hypothetical protein